MARNFLAISATNVSVERTFSKFCHICANLKSSLKANTIREALLSKVWIRSGLLDANEAHQKNHSIPGDPRDTPQILSSLRVLKVLWSL
ncbi:hypothetical protein C8R42DRAFT_752352 [Lentinula raphanica]|nr:hypothetical protein C8R42DRAFT_752352 [Lentinula raphanica]